MARWRRSFFWRIRYAIEDALAGVWRVVSLPWVLLGRWRRAGVRSLANMQRRVTNIRWTRFFLAYLRFPFVAVIRLFGMLRWGLLNWLPRANYWHLLEGMPAVVLAGVLIFPLVGNRYVQSALEYETAGDDAFKKQNYGVAEVYFKALTQFDPQSAKYRYKLAISLEHRGDIAQASALMESLATPHETGYPQAHLWQAWRLLQNPDRADAASVAEAHLLRALRAKGPTAEIHSLLGHLYFSQRRHAEALEQFEKAVPEKPQLAVMVARLYVFQGDSQKARATAQRAVEHFRAQEAASLDNHDARLNLAELYTFLEQFSDAVALLKKGLTLSADERYSAALGRVYLTWAETQRKLPQVNAREQHQLLIDSFRFEPKNLNLLRRLVIGSYQGGDEALLVRNIINECRSRGTSPATSELLSAIDAHVQGLDQSAAAAFRKAFSADPDIGELAGQLARYLVESMPGNLQPPRDIIRMGLAVRPDDPGLLQASGYLKFRTGQFFEALIDAEKAARAPHKAHDRNLNVLLVELYSRLGMPEKARERLNDVFRQPLETPQIEEAAVQ